MKAVAQKIKESHTLQIIAAGSMLLDKYGEAVEVMENEGFIPNEKIHYKVEGDTPHIMGLSTGFFLIEICNALERLKPDIVIAHADRYEQMAVATAASYMNIPLVHTQGGEETGSIDDKVRNAITQLADIHFPATEKSADRIRAMGKDKVYNVGCPSIDLIAGVDLTHKPEDINDSHLYGGVGAEIDLTKPYIVVMFHPNTREYGEGEFQANEILTAVNKLDIQTVWFWPNIDAGNDEISGYIRKMRELGLCDKIRFVKNLPPLKFYKLINNCSLFIGNSSSGIREGSYLGVPYVCIGTRQDKREHGFNTVRVGYSSGEIFDYAEKMIGKKHARDYTFGDGTAGEKIIKILEEL